MGFIIYKVEGINNKVFRLKWGKVHQKSVFIIDGQNQCSL